MTSALSRLALSAETRPLPSSLSISACDVADALVEPLLVEVGQHDRHLQAAREQQRQLRGHQARADDADLGHRAGQRLVGRARRAAWPASAPGRTRRAPARSSSLMIRSASASSSAAKPSSRSAVLRQRDQVERPVGRGGGAVQLAVDEASGPSATASSHASPRSTSGRCDRRPRRCSDAGRPAQRLLQEVGRLEHRVGDAELERLAALEHAVLVERVLDDDLERASPAPIRLRQQVRAAPAGHQAEEALGQRERRARRRRSSGRCSAARARRRRPSPRR